MKIICEDLKLNSRDNSEICIDYKTEETKIIIPSFFDGNEIKKVTSDSYYSQRIQKTIEEIIIEEGIEKVGYKAFEYLKVLKKISLPNSIQEVGCDAFEGCSNLVYNEYKNGKYLGNDTNPYLVLMSVINKNETSFKLHNDTKIIYEKAFDNCDNLNEIKLNSRLERIFCRFSNMKNLKELVIPASVKYISNYLIHKCINFENIIFEEDDSNQELEILSPIISFSNKIESIKLPRRLKKVEEHFVEKCPNLKTFDFSRNSKVQKISPSIFINCYQVKNILNIPQNANIDEKAFIYTHYYAKKIDDSLIKKVPIEFGDIVPNGNQYKLKRQINEPSLHFYPMVANQYYTNIVLGEEVKDVEELIFHEGVVGITMTTKLNARYIELPKTFNDVDILEKLIKNCPKLEMLYIHGPLPFYYVAEANFVICYPFKETLYWDEDELLPNLKYWISYTSQVEAKEIYYEDGIYYQIKEKEARVLKVNENLEEVILRDFVLGKPLTKIRNGAFKGFNGSKIVLPNTLVEIGDRSFKNVNRLKYLVFPESLKTIGSKAFEDSFGINLYVIGEKTKRFGSARWNPSKCEIKYFNTIDKLDEYLKTNIKQVDDENSLFETNEIKIKGKTTICTMLKRKTSDNKVVISYNINGYRSKYVYLDEKFKDVEEIVLEMGIQNLYLDDFVDYKLKRLYLSSTVNCYNIMKFCQEYFPNLEILYVESKSFHHDNTMVNCDFVVCLSYYEDSALKLDDDEQYPTLDFWVKIYSDVKKEDLIINDGVYYLKDYNSYRVIKVDNEYETINIKESINGIIVNKIGPCAFYGSKAKNVNIPGEIEISSNSGVEVVYLNNASCDKELKKIEWIPTFIQPMNTKLPLKYLSNDIFEYRDINGVIYNCSVAKFDEELVCLIRKIINGTRPILEVPSYIYNMKVISVVINNSTLKNVKTLILGNNLKEIDLGLIISNKKESTLEKVILEKGFSMDYGSFLQCVTAKLANNNVKCVFEVDVNDENYCSINGILYSKDKKILLSCRKDMDENDVYPENLETIAQYALYGEVISKELPLSVKNIYDYNHCELKEENMVEVFGKDSLWPICDDYYHAGTDFLDDGDNDEWFLESKKSGIEYHYFVSKNVKFIHPEGFIIEKGKIHISPDNPYFVFSNSFLLSKDRRFLIACLSTRKNLTIPDGVEYIFADLFAVESEMEYNFLKGCYENYIRNKIVLPSTIKKIHSKQKYKFVSEVKKIFIDSKLVDASELNDYFDNMEEFEYNSSIFIKNYDFYNFTDWNKEVRNDLLSFISLFIEPCYEEINGILYIENGTILYKIKDSNIKKIVLNDNVKEISSYAFKDSNVEEIVLNTGLEVIKPLAFMGSKVKELVIPSTVKVMDNAFQDIKHLEKISLNHIEELKRNTFKGCINLKEVELDSLKVIDLDAFNTTLIKEVKISKDIKEIKCNYMGTSNNIESINVDEDNEKYLSIDGVVYTKDGSELLFYPPAKQDTKFQILDSINKISSLNVFSQNDNLETVIFSKYKNKMDYIKEEETSFVNTAFLNYYEKDNKKNVDLKEAITINPIDKRKEKEVLRKNIKITNLKCYENYVEGKAKSEYSDNMYDVKIKNESGYLIGRCSCMAYKNSKHYCKHLYALLCETQKFLKLSNEQLVKDKKVEKEYEERDIEVRESNKSFYEDLDVLLKDINSYLNGEQSKDENDDELLLEEILEVDYDD